MLDRTLMELLNSMIHANTANVDYNCLYYRQAMKANDRDKFRKLSRAQSAHRSKTLGQNAMYGAPQGHETHQDSVVIQMQAPP
jgi:hypothetical protein